LGGNNSMALGLNDRDQAIGVAENSTHDPSCPSPQVLDFEAVTWAPNGQIQSLPPLPGDTVGFALAINNGGQIVGSSGSCANTVVTAVGLFAGPHAVMWQNGSAINLGSLGGTMGKAGAINDRGEVAGFSSVPGDSSVHPFLWTAATGMQDLGPLGTDFLADPAGINNSTQVVGIWFMAWGSTMPERLWALRLRRVPATCMPTWPALYPARPLSRPSRQRRKNGPLKAGRPRSPKIFACCCGSGCPSAGSEPVHWAVNRSMVSAARIRACRLSFSANGGPEGPAHGNPRSSLE
jgi:probable HAF family extracellular repeat protein